MDSEGPEGGRPAARPFDPRPYLRRLQARGQVVDYLDVKWRLVWLRTEHPEARITTEHVTLNEEIAVFRALIELPEGGRASGYGSETRNDFVDYIEKAETKAIGRALAALGYGTQFALDFDLEDGETLEEEPLPGRPTHPAQPEVQPHVAPHVRVVPPPEPSVEPVSEPEFAPIEELRSESVRPAPVEERPEFEPADYSWNEFWKWARGLGYTSRARLEELLGRELGDMTPHEVRRQVIEYRRDQGLPV